jgi:uncharacterized protein (UPF0335 family)
MNNDKLDKIIETLSEMKVVQATQASDLSHHIKRTDLLEERIEQFRAEIKPVVDHVAGIKFLGKIVGITGTVVGILVGIYSFLK